jgi:hypothetical protein
LLIDFLQIAGNFEEIGVRDHPLGGGEGPDLVGRVQLDLHIVGLADHALPQQRQALFFAPRPFAAVLGTPAGNDDGFRLVLQ